MIVANTTEELGRTLDAGAARPVFVPTMGALHRGHGSLISEGVRLAAAAGSGCVVSIFVNPTQFGPTEDFKRYPRTLDADLEMCRAAGAAVVFAPAAEVVYPPGVDVPVPPLPAVATEPCLEDASRPGHFAGVCQVVLRLFQLVRPQTAVFGEKDWQQLQVIKAMTREQGLGIDIVGAPTVRERDGLAMSSRNRFLSAAERGAALSLSQALCEAAGVDDPEQAEARMRALMGAAGAEVQYAVVRDSGTLLRRGGNGAGGPFRALVAARVGSVRLIDNAPWPRLKTG
jgi:pantoate--beta-alanine ligase